MEVTAREMKVAAREMEIRMEIREEERTRTERLQQGGGGGPRPPEPRGQPGTFVVGFGKPAPKLDEVKEGGYFRWVKQFMSWSISNTCDEALKMTSDPIIFQGPNKRSREELECQFGPTKVAAARRAFEGIAAAITNSSHTHKI